MSERSSSSFDPIAEAQRQWTTHGWATAAEGMAAVSSIMRAQQLLLARVDSALRPFSLTFARYEVLMLLTFSSRGSLPLGRVGERLQVNPASVTNAIDRLEAAALVTREPNPFDGRGTLAAITDVGRELARKATLVMNESVFCDLGVSERRLSQLVVLLRDLRRVAGDLT